MIVAPWTPEQVKLLNEFQATSWMHPFTCGFRDEHPSDAGILIAREDGWHCPVPTCGYTQNWALLSMIRRECWLSAPFEGEK